MLPPFNRQVGGMNQAGNSKKAMQKVFTPNRILLLGSLIVVVLMALWHLGLVSESLPALCAAILTFISYLISSRVHKNTKWKQPSAGRVERSISHRKPRQYHRGSGDIISGDKITYNHSPVLNNVIIVAIIIYPLFAYLSPWIGRNQSNRKSEYRAKPPSRGDVEPGIDYYYDIHSLTSEHLNGRSITLTMKDGISMIGTLPVQRFDTAYDRNFILFLPYLNNNKYQRIKDTTRDVDISIIQQMVNTEVLVEIQRSSIEKYDILESTLGGIRLQNGQPVPDRLELNTLNTNKPGHLNFRYRVSGNPKWFEIGDLRIIDSQITLPLELAYISYSAQDLVLVKKTIYALNDNGILTWFDERELLPGDSWEDEIKNAIENSDFVLIFLSSKSIDQPGYMNREIEYAFDQAAVKPHGKRYIIPILLDNCAPPSEFKKLEWLKMWEEGAFEKLLRVLGRGPEFLKIEPK
jgi:hypothetical protein